MCNFIFLSLYNIFAASHSFILKYLFEKYQFNNNNQLFKNRDNKQNIQKKKKYLPFNIFF